MWYFGVSVRVVVIGLAMKENVCVHDHDRERRGAVGAILTHGAISYTLCGVFALSDSVGILLISLIKAYFNSEMVECAACLAPRCETDRNTQWTRALFTI